VFATGITSHGSPLASSTITKPRNEKAAGQGCFRRFQGGLGNTSMTEIAPNASQDNAPRELAEPIARFWKSARDRSKHVRVDLSEFKGHRLVGIRIWETGTDGIDRPTVKGITLAIRKLPELTRALLKAEDRAREMGLLGADDGAAG
jgi:hypothetical protein